MSVLFFNGNPTSSTGWTPRAGASFTNITGTKFGSGVFKLPGVPGSSTAFNQNVYIYDKDPGTYILSGWGKADAVGSTGNEFNGNSPYFGLLAAVVYTDSETEEWHHVPFNKDYSGWQYVSGIVAPKRDAPVKLIRVYLLYTFNANTAYFDNISLVREPVQTYSYDDKGNPVSAKDGGARTSCEYETGTSLLKKYTASTGVVMNFTYESTTHNLHTTSYDGITTTNSYTNGLLTGTNTVAADWTKQQSSSAYNSYGQKTGSNDVNNITSSYTYNNQFLVQGRTNTIGGETVTQTTNYDAVGRMTNTYIAGRAIQYNHLTNGMLTDISRKSFNNAATSTGEHWQTYHLNYDRFGNTTDISINSNDINSLGSSEGGRQLVSYSYKSDVNNGIMTQMRYSNGQFVDYEYDLFDRLVKETYNSGTDDEVEYNYVYAADGNLAEQYSSTGERYSYEYDSLGRLIRSKQTNGGNLVQRTEHIYDESNRITAQSRYNGSEITKQIYKYGENDGLLNELDIYFPGNTYNETPGANNTPSLYYTVDYTGLNQLKSKTSYNAQAELFKQSRNYINLGDGRRTNQVWFLNYRDSEGNLIWGREYGYDANGNISTERKTDDDAENTLLYSYVYDKQNQLTGVNGANGTALYSYSYDSAGNIRSASNGSTTHTYSYDDASWADLLTAYDGHEIEYDACGNPTSYYNGTDWGFTWKNGRQLASAAVEDDTSVSYTYDMAGVRSSKTVNGTTYNYTTLSGLVVNQTWGNKSIDFIYDESNQPYLMRYKEGNSEPELYYYVLNAQGDVVGLMYIDDNNECNLVAQYEYDPWGKLLETNITVSESDTNYELYEAVAEANPLRYRGYYYDTETGFYYLQTRYYDPAICRFINADTYVTTNVFGLLSANMFAYCENNPVNCRDCSGCMTLALAGGGYAALGGGNAVALIAGYASLLSPAGWLFVGVAAIAITAIAVNSYKSNGNNSRSNNNFIKNYASSTASPPGPNKPDDERKTNVTKSESPVWRKFKSVKNSRLKTSGNGQSQQYYEWDYTHNDIEVYNYRGQHLGSMDPVTGDIYKPPVPGRTIKIP